MTRRSTTLMLPCSYDGARTTLGCFCASVASGCCMRSVRDGSSPWPQLEIYHLLKSGLRLVRLHDTDLEAPLPRGTQLVRSPLTWRNGGEPSCLEDQTWSRSRIGGTAASPWRKSPTSPEPRLQSGCATAALSRGRTQRYGSGCPCVDPWPPATSRVCIPFLVDRQHEQ